MSDPRALVVLAALAAALILTWAVCIAPGRMEDLRCASMKTRAEAHKAYRAGATWLDADHDGVPCESLP